jgi:hypothetical protein
MVTVLMVGGRTGFGLAERSADDGSAEPSRKPAETAVTARYAVARTAL